MKRTEVIDQIRLANNSAYLGLTRRDGATVFRFSATEGSALGIVRSCRKLARMNEVFTIEITKRLGYGNEYDLVRTVRTVRQDNAEATDMMHFFDRITG